ncbi:hypothetical protein EJ110_NYTH24052 [Nymphaea thermarum]|nr:hypothetical protein EJ110_NYTH24052 [Nymphaea thermarum]
MLKATRSYLTLCLCRTNERDPFISAIEVRPLPGDDVYPVVNATLALTNLERQNYGRRDGNWYRQLIKICAGFINIDCGSQVESYVHPNTTLTYFSDSKIMEFGEIKTPESNYTDGYPEYFWKLRTFPKGNRTCYKLQPVTPGSKYLVRPTFLYGNFDGLNSFPQFDLYLENTFVQIINASISDWVFTEIIVEATRGYLTLCLCETNERDPFISAIEVRPLPGDDVYPVVNATLALNYLYRSNFGRRDGNWYRFPDDTLDRFWLSPLSDGLGSINTTKDLIWSPLNISESVSSTDDHYVPPSVVMQTANINSDPKGRIQWNSTTIPQDADLFMCIHFAELKKLEPNETREFNITLDYKLWHGAFRPPYLSATTLCSTSIYRSQNNLVEFNPTERSTLSPIVNAMELYTVLQLSGSTTDDVDDAWTGDPCLPLNFTWEGLVCSNNRFSPRFHISNRNEIIACPAPRNLSGNNLTGNMPVFLVNLPQLKMLWFWFGIPRPFTWARRGCQNDFSQIQARLQGVLYRGTGTVTSSKFVIPLPVAFSSIGVASRSSFL